MVGIYKIRNKINGKIYIGQSIKIEERWKSHILNSRQEKITDSSQVIHKAINKYGVENFEFSILEECDEASLDEREIYWISVYDSYYNGYNCTKGGNRNVDHFKKKVYYYDLTGKYLGQFESVTQAAQLLKISPLLISKCCLGKFKSTHNLQFSYEKKIMGFVVPTEGKAKRVGQFTKNGILIKEYESASEAARVMNLTKYSIADCCRGRQKTSAGYIWKYL